VDANEEDELGYLVWQRSDVGVGGIEQSLAVDCEESQEGESEEVALEDIASSLDECLDATNFGR